ncbi:MULTISPECIES: HWE histidine kinase domain-containing protein [unclassified Methylobacterium]|jgi:two-component sensor histidine kinase|uniref:HWE histidine kinase domain-containing protein n=1 Tax=unclassified Methylobacterium TaxID=2615210 RepID=UPI001353123D|nr:HWE histidine kinase domain-containing protein [Methylobacterium sp. 2A]MWV25608.1 sensor histidine kinase [Methylobacterium sp. 2A]
MTDPGDLQDRLAVLEADNARLRRLLDAAGVPDSLRHGLHNTLAIMRAIMHRSAESAGDVEGYVAHLDGRFGAVMRVQAATDVLGEADLHSLISDELMFHLVREGDQATLTGPRVRLRPKAALVLALALHELASNAVEHGSLSLPQGRVDVRWEARPSDGAETADPVLQLDWKEQGGVTVVDPSRRGFGTEVLLETLVYQLDAQTVLDFESDGLHFRLCLPLVPTVGHVLAEDATEAARAAGIADEA